MKKTFVLLFPIYYTCSQGPSPVWLCGDFELHSDVEGSLVREKCTYLIDAHGMEGTE